MASIPTQAHSEDDPVAKLTSDSSNRELSPIQPLIDLLEELARNPEKFASLSDQERTTLLSAAGKLSRPDQVSLVKRRKAAKLLKKQLSTRNEREARATTGIRLARTQKVFTAPDQLSIADSSVEDSPVLNSPRPCYVCNEEFTKLHFFYDSMCPKCADFNYKKRFQTAPMDGQVALITGARLKIGYQSALMMLRSGATVIVTTRFPVDAAIRFAKEKDFAQWKARLQVFGLDLRHTPSVEIFCTIIEQSYERLDVLINNAAQTVRRPPAFYAHLMEAELQPIENLPMDVQELLQGHRTCVDKLMVFSDRIRGQVEDRPNAEDAPHISNSNHRFNASPSLSLSWQEKTPGMGLRSSAQLSQIPYTHDDALVVEDIFPVGELDADLQQVDLRETNSWRLRLGEIKTAEMLELQLINAVAPFVLCNRLATMMKRDYTGQKHIVNVSAIEGKFFRFKKPDRHPHTNMAKAALNMLTHTSASDLAKYGIFMNAVDTGWVTDEDPAHLSKFKEEHHDFQPPLDIVDGAARVCDPFFDGILTGQHWCGKFLKDYFPIDW